MSDRNEQNEYYQYYGSFPYKSYDQILAEKRRKRRYKRGLFGMLVLFCFLALALVSISVLVGRREEAAEEDARRAETAQPGNAQVQTPSAGSTDDFSLSEGGAQTQSGVVYRDVSKIVEQCSAAVVGIVTESYQNFSQTSAGSGIVLTENGYIVTNNHVVSGGDNITVVLEDGTNYSAYLIGSDAYTDLAVLKIEAKGLTCATLGDSDELRVGEVAVVIGNPTGQLQGTVTGGLISALNRNIAVEGVTMTLIQTDAAVNGGNSGGPLLNEYGQVVGIISAKLSSTAYEGLGFAIPVNTVKPIVKELVQNGYVSGRPSFGIAGRSISSMAARFYGFPQGILVDAVESTSDARAQGIAQGDIIVSVNGKTITTVDEGCLVRNELPVGSKVK
ncbi:MAG: trypsin-like serine protease, partial [Clostridia bacterium]|nr:trypsin-like serine protease [Clostridia bacterium]